MNACYKLQVDHYFAVVICVRAHAQADTNADADDATTETPAAYLGLCKAQMHVSVTAERFRSSMGFPTVPKGGQAGKRKVVAS